MRCAFALALMLSATVFAQSIFDDEWEPPKRGSGQPEKVEPPAKEEPREEEPAQPEPDPMEEEPVVAEELKPVEQTDDGRIRLDDNRFEEPKTQEKAPEPLPEPPADVSNLSPTEQKLRMGLEQLKAENSNEAIDTFRTLLNELPKSTSPKLDDPNRINAMHGLAAAYLQLNDVPKARQQMDRIYACPKTNRSIVLNQAIIDMQSRDTVRAAMMLSRHLEGANTDERAINLLGIAIKRAVKEKRSAAMKKHIEDYMRFEAALEKTRPDMKRWGSSWIKPAEHRRMMKERSEQIGLCKKISGQIEDAEDDVDRAKREYHQRRLNPPSVVEFYKRRVTEAEERVDALEDELKRERREIVNPTWEEDFTPISPELELKDK